MKPRFTEAQVVEAIQGSHGIKTVIIRKLGISLPTLDHYLDKYSAANQALLDERSVLIDKAESVVVTNLDKDDFMTARFVLTTIGKDRGWVERVDHAHALAGTVVVEVVTSNPKHLT